MKKIYRYFSLICIRFSQYFAIPCFLILAAVSRFLAIRKFDIGIGPQPLVNHIYHKQSLEKYGYKVQTFAHPTYFITSEFDIIFQARNIREKMLNVLRIYLHILFNYKAIYIYFNGTIPYSKEFTNNTFIAFEALFYKVAGIKVVVMPYGGDIQNMSLCQNLLFKNALIKDYPIYQKELRQHIIKSIDKWTASADHIIAGCDWVWYLYHWDTLLSGHFSIDTDKIKPMPTPSAKKGGTIRILHAPNHMAIKGSKHFIDAVNELKKEGYNVEMVFVQKMSNTELLKLMSTCHIVADQLIIGWYAMTAIEAMALGKPVLCYLDKNLLDLYYEQGVINKDDMPIVQCDYASVKSVIKDLLDNPDKLKVISKKSRKFAEKYHSIDFIGSVFDKINKSIGLGKTFK